MPEYQTPEPIAVTLELGIVGVLRITAGDRADTVVDVRPTDESDESDVRAAQQVEVDLTGGTLRVTGPKARPFDFSRRSRSVDVTIDLPSGSAVSARVQVGELRCAGTLGECRLRTSGGDVRLDRTGPLRLHTAAGHVTVGAVVGTADLTTGSGRIRAGEIDGPAVIKNSNGDTGVDAVSGDLRVRAANGDITVGRAGAGVDAKTANGSVRLGEVVSGSIALGTAMGDLDVGIADGTAAWLEINTSFGHVRNQLDSAVAPGDGVPTVAVRGSTSHGDITIHRS